jgi:hypothetical protein
MAMGQVVLVGMVQGLITLAFLYAVVLNKYN